MKSSDRHRRATPSALLAAWSRLGMAMDALVTGKSSADIATEIRAGKDPKQAAAIAYSVAGKDAGANLDGLLARWGKIKSATAQDADRWITVKPNGPHHKGVPVQIDENGTIKHGMGGKFNGEKIGEIRKDFTGPKSHQAQPAGSKPEVAQQSTQQKTSAKNRAEINRYLGYLKNSESNGYVYENGILKLQSLAKNVDPETASEIKSAIEKHRAAVAQQKIEKKKRQEAARAQYNSTPQSDRNYLNVPYSEKDAAKRLGAKWDADRRQWYFSGSDLPDGLKRYSRTTPKYASQLTAKSNSTASHMMRALPSSSRRIDESDPSVWGYELLGHEGETWGQFLSSPAGEDFLNRTGRATPRIPPTSPREHHWAYSEAAVQRALRGEDSADLGSDDPDDPNNYEQWEFESDYPENHMTKENSHENTSEIEIAASKAHRQTQSAGILFLCYGRVLLLMRSPLATDYPNTWGFPAGHIEPGESPLLAALREAKEKVGTAPESADPLSNENGFALFLARGDVIFQPTLNDESAGYVWADPDALPQPLHPGVEEAIRAALAGTGTGMDEADIAQAVELADAWAADGTARALDTNGWFEVKDNPLSKVGIFPYRGRALPGAPDPDHTYRVYRPADELGAPETVDSFKLLPWIDNHPPGLLGREEDGLTRPESKGVQGVTGEDVWFDPDAFEHGGLFGNIKLFSSAMADQIQAGKKQLSAGFRCTYDWTPGTFDGKPYDCVQRNIRGNHLASVKQGRMGPDVAVLDHGEIVIDLLPERNIMADTSTNAPEGGASSGMTLEDAREKFNEIVQQIDVILQALPALKQALEPGNPDNSNPDVPLAADARGKDADDTGPFADPEGKKYPLRNDEEIRAAWDYIHMRKDGDEYSPEQRKQVEDRIVAAWKDKIDKSGPPEAQAKDADVKPIEKKETAMDEAEMFRGFERKMASRNKLVDQLSKHVGTFDATGMDEADVASYGCRKLGLKAPKGQEMAYLNGFLAAAKSPTAVPAKAMDSGDGGWLNKQRAFYNV